MPEKPVVSWLLGGILLGGLLLVAVAVAKPLGVSTQYVSAVAGVCELADPGACETVPYFKAEKIGFGYAEMVVLGIPLGALLAALLSRRFRRRDVPEPWAARFGRSKGKRFAAAALGGFLILSARDWPAAARAATSSPASRSSRSARSSSSSARSASRC
jgi:hypothetical protein